MNCKDVIVLAIAIAMLDVNAHSASETLLHSFDATRTGSRDGQYPTTPKASTTSFGRFGREGKNLWAVNF